MVPRLREFLTLALIALLPFHALGVTVFTRIVSGPNQPPMGVFALWKEVLLGIVLFLAVFEWITKIVKRKHELRVTSYEFFSVDVIDACILLLAVDLLLVTFIRTPELVTRSLIYSIRYDLVPLAAFFILRRVDWSAWFVRRAPIVLVAGAGIAALYALITFILPESFFSLLGYSDLHSLYVPGRPIAAFQQIGGTALRRVQGPMSGPNQLGIWLAAALPFVWSLRSTTHPAMRRIAAALLLFAIVLTFSRAAWIATAVVLVIALWPQLQRLSVTAVTTLCIGILAISVTVLLLFPSVILRVESSLDHLRNPLEALTIMVHEPLGRGLGSAGPAHNRVADACVFVEEGSDVAWAAPHADLCVFAGATQVQPIGRACTCPLLPENWYLQLGVEGGWIAFIAFIALIVVLLRRVHQSSHPLARQTFLAFLAVSIAALFLHAWEDAATAYAAWILGAVVLTASAARPNRPVGGDRSLHRPGG